MGDTKKDDYDRERSLEEFDVVEGQANGWSKYEVHVLRELKRLDTRMNNIERLLFGVLASVVVAVIVHLATKG